MNSINVVISSLVLAQLIYIGAPPVSFAHTITGVRTEKSTKIRNIAWDMNCKHFGHYIELFHLTELDPCLNRSVDIWEPLNELLQEQHGTYDCIDSIIKALSIVFETPLQNDCNCTEEWFHLPYENISYNPKTLSSHPSSTTTKRLTASTNHPSTVSSILTNVITTAMHLPIVSHTTTKVTPPSTTVMSVTIAPPPRHGGRRRFVSDSVANNSICLTQDLTFKELYELFYVHKDPKYPDEMIHYAPSLSHQFVWKKLSLVQPNCRKILIQDLANTYGYNHFEANYTCIPGSGRVVTHSTSPATLTIKPTTTTKITTQTLHPTDSTHTTGHFTSMTTAKTHTTLSTTALKTTIVQTQHQNHSTHTTGHSASVTTAKTHTTVPSITLKTTMVQTQHQNISTNTTGHVISVSTANMHTTMPSTTLKTTMVQTQHQNPTTHTTGHVTNVTTAKTQTTLTTGALKTTMVQTQHQNHSTHTTGHVISVTHSTKPSSTMKTTMVQTQHHNASSHTTGHVISVSTANLHTTMPSTTMKTTMVPTQHQNPTTHTTGHVISVSTANLHTTMPSTTMKTTMVPTQHQNPTTHTTGHVISVSTANLHTTMPSTTMKTTMVPTQHQNPTTHTTVVTVSKSSTVSHTMSPAVTTHTTSSAATTTYANCNAQDLTYGIEHKVVLSPSSNCLSKVFHSEEIFNSYCTLPHIEWTPGPKVLDMCQSLPNNTAVATFVSGTFNPKIDIAAIFMGCIDSSDGFRAAIALCNATISIQDVTIDNSIEFHLPDQYYVVKNVEG